MEKDNLKLFNNEEIQKKYDKLQEQANEIYSKVGAIYAEQEKLFSQVVNLKGKYVYFKDSNVYLYVGTQFYGSGMLTVRGFGFKSSFSPYADDNYFEWDAFKSIDIHITRCHTFEDVMKDIEIITEDRFNQAFKEAYDKTIEAKNKFIEYWEKEQ
jgi:hypothetical protein